MAFMKKIDDTINKRRTDKVVSDLKNKKNMLQTAVNNEISYVKKQIADEYIVIGESSYKLFMEGNLSSDNLTVHFEKITGYFKEIEEKEAKIKEISVRYDEEISLLRQFTTVSANISMSSPHPNIVDNTCPNCKTSYNKGIDIFCTNCGNSLTTS